MTFQIVSSPDGSQYGSLDAMRAFFGTGALSDPRVLPGNGQTIAVTLGDYTINLFAQALVVNTVVSSSNPDGFRITAGTITGFNIFQSGTGVVAGGGAVFNAPTFWNLLWAAHDGNAAAFLSLWDTQIYRYVGGNGPDHMRGGTQDDTFDWVGNGDIVLAGGGDDIINVVGDAAEIYGGAGENLIVFQGSAKPERVEEINKFEVLNTDIATIDLSLLTLSAHVEIKTGFGATVIGSFGIDEIIGGSGEDKIRGGPDGDIIDGGAGNDVIYGDGIPTNNPSKFEGGNDIIDGGEGIDTVVLWSSYSAYTIKKGTDGEINVAGDSWITKLHDGLDGLKEIEKLRFSDQEIDLSVALAANWFNRGPLEALKHVLNFNEAWLEEWYNHLNKVDAAQSARLAKLLSESAWILGVFVDLAAVTDRVRLSTNQEKTLFVEYGAAVIGVMAMLNAGIIGFAVGGPLGPLTAIIGAGAANILYDQVVNDFVKARLGVVYDNLFASQNDGAGMLAAPHEAVATLTADDVTTFDEAFYLNAHSEVLQDIQAGRFPSALAHFLTVGIDLGYEPNSTQTITRAQLVAQVNNSAALPFSAQFDTAIGNYAGDGVSTAEQSIVGLINAERAAAQSLALDAKLSALAHRKAVDLVQNWPVNAVSEAENQPNSNWSNLWSTNQSFRAAFKPVLDSVIGTGAAATAFKVLVGESQNGSAATALTLLKQKSDAGALTNGAFDTVGVAEYGGIWVIVLADRKAGYVPVTPGADTLTSLGVYGTDGADKLFAGTRTINAIGQDWTDELVGGGGNDILNGGAGNDTLNGGAGLDTADYTAATSAVTVNLLTKTSSGPDGRDTFISIENLLGSRFADKLTGNNSGNRIDGGPGADVMAGGRHNDVYIVDNTLDKVVEAASAGTDTVISTVTFTLAANVENLTLTGNANINGTGNSAVNVITGNAGANILKGGSNADTLRGSAGNDTYVVDHISDKAIEAGNAGTDRVLSAVRFTLGANVENLALTGTANINGTGNASNNSISGNAGNNILIGLAGLDLLSGSIGNDTLIGGAGSDRLTGGAGLDKFVFNAALVSTNADRVVDFSVKDDAIHLENAVFSKLSAGALKPAAFFKGAGAHDADDRIIYNSATGALIYDSNGIAGGGAVQFATLAKNLALTPADFIVI